MKIKVNDTDNYVISGCDVVHIERLSGKGLWLGLYSKDGKRVVRVNFYSKGKLEGRITPDKGAEHVIA